MIIVRERLRLLSIAFYVSGGLGAFFASFLMIYVIMFGAFSFLPAKAWNPPSHHGGTADLPSAAGQTALSSPDLKSDNLDNSPVIIFRVFAGVMFFFVLCGWLLAAATIYAGRCLATRRNRVFIYIMSGINMIWIPYGTLLGIATIIVLNTNVAKEEFGLPGNKESAPPIPS